MDSATRCGLYVPVTTIGTVPILERDLWTTRLRMARYIIPVSGAIGSADDTSPFAVRFREPYMTLVANPGEFADSIAPKEAAPKGRSWIEAKNT
jgi:hypothetical protein